MGLLILGFLLGCLSCNLYCKIDLKSLPCATKYVKHGQSTWIGVANIATFQPSWNVHSVNSSAEQTGDAMVVSTKRTITETEPAAAVGERATGQVKTLMKGLAVLEMIIMRESVRTTDVAATFGIDKGSASRILRTLAQSGFVACGKGRRYTLGPKLALASARRSSGAALRATARGLLESLVEQTGESAHLGILADGQVLYLDRADSGAPLRVRAPSRYIGSLALHCAWKGLSGFWQRCDAD